MTSAGSGAPPIAAAARIQSAAAKPGAARRGTAQRDARTRSAAPSPSPSSAIDSAVEVACALPMYANSRVDVSSRTRTTNVTTAIVAAERWVRVSSGAQRNTRADHARAAYAGPRIPAISHSQSLKNRQDSQACVFGARCVGCAAMTHPRPFVLSFQNITDAQAASVGGKGANLAALSRVAGVRVPDGFCVTTDAFERIAAAAPAIDGLLDRVSRVQPDDRDAIRGLAAELRQTIEAVPIPGDLADAITRPLTDAAYAVRSSATAEDLPTASFAGQHDTYLNVVGPVAVLAHVRRCWASLYTERAVTYRLRHGFDHRKVRMAVVIQRLVVPQAAGILFTADPVTGHRKVTSIDASFGLGEALVSGLVNPDVFEVRDGVITARTIA